MFEKQYLEKINNSEYLFIDMDGTLIDTDKANNAAYLKAIYAATGKKIEFKNQRIVKSLIFKLFDFQTAQKIVELKNDFYPEFLYLTSVNHKLADFINRSNKQCILLSHSNSKRGNQTLEYHNLEKLNAKNLFFEKNKFVNGIETLNINPNKVFVFDNEIEQKYNAVKAGIPINNIYLFNN